MHADRVFDISVVGAGATGLTAALALAREGFDTCLIGRTGAAEPDGRTTALLDGSVSLMKALGAWNAMKAEAAPLATMRIIDDTGSLFRPSPAAFRAAEIGLDAFGWNVENGTLVRHLLDRARNEPRLTLIEGELRNSEIVERFRRLFYNDKLASEARLVVAADGRRSSLRTTARVETRFWSYPQVALTTLLDHDRPHENASTEFHTRDGPFTLVPLPGRRSSLVWVMRPDKAEQVASLEDEALGRVIERQAQSVLGRMRVAGPRGVVAMSGLSVERYHAPRLALVGEAAHVFPPIGAQGLNLGLRDVAALRDAVVDAREAGEDIGGAGALSRYQRSRALDVRLRTAAVDGLNRTLLSGSLPFDLLRGAGLLALSGLGPLRRAVMREGVLPTFGAPRLMRA